MEFNCLPLVYLPPNKYLFQGNKQGVCQHMWCPYINVDIHLYRIPDSGPIVIFRRKLSPLAIYVHGTNMESRNVVKWFGIRCARGLMGCSLYPFTIEQDALILLALGQLDDVPQYLIDGLCSIGNSHTIGWEDFNNMEKMGLGCFTHFISHSEHAGYVCIENVSHGMNYVSCAAHWAIGTCQWWT